MSIPLLILVGFAVVAVTTMLLKFSGAGRELFGRDSWMLNQKPEAEPAEKGWGSLIENHEFWESDSKSDDFWDVIPEVEREDDDEDGPDIAIASGDA